MAEAFRTYALDQPQTARTVRARILKYRQEQIEQLGTGYARDFADYKNRAGVIEGLNIAAGIAEEVEKEERA